MSENDLPFDPASRTFPHETWQVNQVLWIEAANGIAPRKRIEYWEIGMAKGYTKIRMPLGKVKDKEFLSRSMGCKGVGFSFVRYKPGQGATYVHRHKVQEEVFITLKGTGSLILDGKRISIPEGTCIRVAPRVYRALGNDSKKDVVYMILGAVPPKNFPLGGRTLLGDGIPNREKVPRWKKA